MISNNLECILISCLILYLDIMHLLYRLGKDTTNVSYAHMANGISVPCE